MSATTSTILCVDDEPNVLRSLERLLRGRNVRVLTADGGAKALELLASEAVDVLVSDMRMPGMDGAELLAIAGERWPDTVRLLLTGHSDQRDTVRAINAGKIFGYYSKPWDADVLTAAIASAVDLAQMTREKARLEAENRAQSDALKELNGSLEVRVQERTQELELAHGQIKRSYMNSIKVFANLIELRGGQLIGHGRRVADMSRTLAVSLGCGGDEVQRIFVAGLLHDIGLIGMPDAALVLPTAKLDANQQSLYKRHAALGEQSLIAFDDLQPVAGLIRAHHERWDGKGFPDGLAGDRIELGARILAVADRYDEFLSGAFGVPRVPAASVPALLERGRGTLFDPRVLDALAGVASAPAEAPKPACSAAIGWARLEPGMELATGLLSTEGALLLSADHVLTAEMIERIRVYARRESRELELQIKSTTLAPAAERQPAPSVA